VQRMVIGSSSIFTEKNGSLKARIRCFRKGECLPHRSTPAAGGRYEEVWAYARCIRVHSAVLRRSFVPRRASPVQPEEASGITKGRIWLAVGRHPI